MPKLQSNEMIESYVSGSSMRVAGKTYTTDLKIIGDTVKGNWWRREGHRLLLDDIVDILDSGPDLLVVGTGYAGNLDIPANLRRDLAERGIRLLFNAPLKLSNCSIGTGHKGKTSPERFTSPVNLQRCRNNQGDPRRILKCVLSFCRSFLT